MEKISALLNRIDDFVWGPWMLGLLLGTGVYLMIRMHFLPIRNLGYALKCVVGLDSLTRAEKNERTKPEERKAEGRSTEHPNPQEGKVRPQKNRKPKSTKEGAISPFSSLMTELATTIGTGNIVGVATAMVLGGPGALVWMVISSFIGLSTKFAESMLAVKYRVRNSAGELSGGPMYMLENGFPRKRTGHVLACLFAFFAVFASFGMGNMTQANSIATAVEETFGVRPALTGLIVTIATILVVLGGIGTISKVTLVMVPVMAILYLTGAVTVILVHRENIPAGLWMILSMAFSPKAVAGGIGGHLVSSMQQALRWGVSRGVFSNEAGLGAAGISAAAAHTDDPVRQGYISMTSVFLDTVVICSITGLALAASGVLGMLDTNGQLLTGTALTIAAFETTFGEKGGMLVTIGIVLFAFATIIGWAYQGEKAFEFLVKKTEYCIMYRFVYGFMCFIGAVCALDVVWSFSDICNGLMAVPNLIGVLVMSEEVCRAIRGKNIEGKNYHLSKKP